MPEIESTPVQSAPVDPAAVVAAHAEQAKLRSVAAATATRSGQRSTAGVRRIVVNKPDKASKPAKPAVVRTGTARSTGKRTPQATPAKPAAVSVSDAEAKRLVEESVKVQRKLIDEARTQLVAGDIAQWKVAALSFQATQEDGPAKMDQQAWATALGVSAPTVSRWIKTHAEYGLEAARQYVGRGEARRQLSFNDHMEMLKNKDDKATQRAILQAVLANGTSYATELKRHRDKAKNGTAKDRATQTTADLIAQVTAGEETRIEAFQELAQGVVNSFMAFAQAFDGISDENLDDTIKVIARSVVDQGLAFERIFTERVS